MSSSFASSVLQREDEPLLTDSDDDGRPSRSATAPASSPPRPVMQPLKPAPHTVTSTTSLVTISHVQKPINADVFTRQAYAGLQAPTVVSQGGTSSSGQVQHSVHAVRPVTATATAPHHQGLHTAVHHRPALAPATHHSREPTSTVPSTVMITTPGTVNSGLPLRVATTRRAIAVTRTPSPPVTGAVRPVVAASVAPTATDSRPAPFEITFGDIVLRLPVEGQALQTNGRTLSPSELPLVLWALCQELVQADAQLVRQAEAMRAVEADAQRQRREFLEHIADMQDVEWQQCQRWRSFLQLLRNALECLTDLLPLPRGSAGSNLQQAETELGVYATSEELHGIASCLLDVLLLQLGTGFDRKLMEAGREALVTHVDKTELLKLQQTVVASNERVAAISAERDHFRSLSEKLRTNLSLLTTKWEQIESTLEEACAVAATCTVPKPQPTASPALHARNSLGASADPERVRALTQTRFRASKYHNPWVFQQFYFGLPFPFQALVSAVQSTREAHSAEAAVLRGELSRLQDQVKSLEESTSSAWSVNEQMWGTIHKLRSEVSDLLHCKSESHKLTRELELRSSAEEAAQCTLRAVCGLLSSARGSQGKSVEETSDIVELLSEELREASAATATAHNLRKELTQLREHTLQELERWKAVAAAACDEKASVSRLLHKQLDAANERCAELERESQETDEKIGLFQKMNEEHARVIERLRINKDAERELSELKKQNEQLKEMVESEKREKSSLVEQLMDCEEDIARLSADQRQMDEQTDHIARLDRQILAERALVDHLRQRLQETQGLCDTRETDAVRRRADDLQKLVDELQHEVTLLRQVVEADDRAVVYEKERRRLKDLLASVHDKLAFLINSRSFLIQGVWENYCSLCAHLHDGGDIRPVSNIVGGTSGTSTPFPLPVGFATPGPASHNPRGLQLVADSQWQLVCKYFTSDEKRHLGIPVGAVNPPTTVIRRYLAAVAAAAAAPAPLASLGEPRRSSTPKGTRRRSSSSGGLGIAAGHTGSARRRSSSNGSSHAGSPSPAPPPARPYDAGKLSRFYNTTEQNELREVAERLLLTPDIDEPFSEHSTSPGPSP